MAVMLFIGGGLLIHSFVKLTRVDPGYDATHVITFRPSLETSRDPIAPARGVRSVHRTAPRDAWRGGGRLYRSTLPTMLDRGFMPLRRTPPPPGRLLAAPPAPPGSGPPPDRASPRYVSQHYLRSMGVSIVAGRGFTDQDRAGQPPVMLVNEAVVRSGILGSNPLGMPVCARPPALDHRRHRQGRAAARSGSAGRSRVLHRLPSDPRLSVSGVGSVFHRAHRGAAGADGRRDTKRDARDRSARGAVERGFDGRDCLELRVASHGSTRCWSVRSPSSR